MQVEPIEKLMLAGTAFVIALSFAGFVWLTDQPEEIDGTPRHVICLTGGLILFEEVTERPVRFSNGLFQVYPKGEDGRLVQVRGDCLITEKDPE